MGASPDRSAERATGLCWTAGFGGDRDRSDVAASQAAASAVGRSARLTGRQKTDDGRQKTGNRESCSSVLRRLSSVVFGTCAMAEIRVPALGESVTEATIGKWFKRPGDAVAVDEPLVELETDKVTIEVPAPAAGVLAGIAAKDGETVAVGALLGEIKEGAGAAGKSTAAPPGRPEQKIEAAAPIKVAEEAQR